MIAFSHVYKTFRGEVHALRDVTFNINKGDFVFLTGHSGAGKTTLFNLLAGFDRATSGQVIVANYNLNDLLRIILETMFRGMGFDRVLLCTRDMRSNSMPARIGFGPGVDKLLKTFAVPLGKSQDVFQVAIDKQADIFLSDINAPNICDRIPAWYRTLISAQTFILLPLAIDKKVIGMFYADKAEAGSLMIPAQELNLLKTLRNQAVLAIRQKQIG